MWGNWQSATLPRERWAILCKKPQALRNLLPPVCSVLSCTAVAHPSFWAWRFSWCQQPGLSARLRHLVVRNSEACRENATGRCAALLCLQKVKKYEDKSGLTALSDSCSACFWSPRCVVWGCFCFSQQPTHNLCQSKRWTAVFLVLGEKGDGISA